MIIIVGAGAISSFWGSETESILLTIQHLLQQQSFTENLDMITCVASEVLKAGHGICFAKSHLLSALLRCKSIPTGFCYQKILLDENITPVLIYHGLNGVYIKEKKWIRLDARGKKMV